MLQDMLQPFWQKREQHGTSHPGSALPLVVAGEHAGAGSWQLLDGDRQALGRGTEEAQKQDAAEKDAEAA